MSLKEKTNKELAIAKEKAENAKRRLVEEARNVNGKMEDVKEDSKEKMAQTLEDFHRAGATAQYELNAVKHIEENTKAGTMSIVSSSLSKTADWLTKISNKIQNK